VYLAASEVQGALCSPLLCWCGPECLHNYCKDSNAPQCQALACSYRTHVLPSYAQLQAGITLGVCGARAK
jgi:hypothetical protein